MVKEKNGQQRPLADFVRSAPQTKSQSAARSENAAPENAVGAKPQFRTYTVSPQALERAATMKRNEGLDNISRAMERDRPLAADDVRKLKPADLEGIRKQGDAHMREMVKQREAEKQQERQQEMGRSRERDR